MKLTLTAAVAGTKNQSTVSITVNPAPTISGTLPIGSVGDAYTATLTASGGTAPLKLSFGSGSLPAGLSFDTTTGVISGTPTTVGTSSFTVKVTDASDVPNTVSASEIIVIGTGQGGGQSGPLTVIGGNPPTGTVGTPYSTSLQATGGATPYTWNILSGALPAGLTISPSTGTISGTPTTQETSTFTAQVKDALGTQASASFSITINAATSPLTLTLTTLPGATVGVPYTGTIGATGGTAPYSCAITAGSLPAGLTLNGCVVSGTPTTAGTSTITVKVTDSSNPTQSVTGPVTLTVSPAALTLTLSSLPNATVGTPYTSTIGVSGGTSPYACAITSGTLPAGLTLTGCVVSGTPTVAGTAHLTVKATDSSNPVETTTGPVSLTVLPAAVTLTLTSPPDATVGTPYTGTIGVSGGTGPYSCTVTAGTLPAGLSISGCVISGTPTIAGTADLTVKATDSSSPAATTTGPVSLTVVAAGATLTLTSPPDATVGTPYTGTIGVSGGTGPYSCTVTAGTLPAGLSISGCTISGTPTTAGTANLTVKATDSSSPVNTTTGPVTLKVLPIGTLSLTGSLPNATLGQPYTQTLHAIGGVAPYTYTVTTGGLPAGLSLSPSGDITGTPTAVGASSFTISVKDSESTPQTATNAYVLLVVYPTTPNDSELNGPYAYLFQGYDDVLAGVLAYQTATVGSFTADGAGVLSNGELDSNHQTSNPTGSMVGTDTFIGTYTIGTNNRGSLTITTLNADGTTGNTSTYAIALKAPVAPSTISVKGDLIEFDNNSLQGTKGSGTLLAQQPTDFAAGLNGSYAFGLQGDTPCLPTCTVGIIAGPTAAVGQFTTNGAGAISGGTSDANIATANFANEALSGSYGVADGNGRLQLTMNTAGMLAGVYPQDYAVYMVSANHAFVLSTDKHSAYILFAGSAQLQTQSTFSNVSMSGPIIGYENAQSNPGLLGTTLQDVLNFSTSTIFRATANAGTCDTTNVDVAGVTGLVNQITGLGGLLPTNVVQALLGTYQSTGNSSCTVGSNGRGVFNYPAPSGAIATLLGLLGLDNPPAPRVFYLVGPNQGYFLETGYAGLGNFDPQIGAPFSIASFDGTFVYGTAPASSLASINSSGVIVANGAGQATSTLDLNVGLGTVNLLQLGVTSTSNYTLTDATAGRFTMGTSVIYEIAPGNFVLLDTNPVTTSPSIVLLY
ncbi:beta strand repeat-containing protein [Edaphobacter dinghuensis]|nr:putative Ig domain-containing protein [Edaphobacter dinghuensis]